ncbi:MAG: carboxypeptidase M32 [Candidatus Lokiarchaeota archaeon]|nr:carboxypeptidase M32 [Candidatus Lokiarchaeota archaeon]
MSNLNKLRKRFSELKKINYLNNLLQWDQQVYMPDGAINDKSNLIKLVSKIYHKKLTSDKTKELIKESEKIENLNLIDSAILREAKREYEKAIKIPIDLVKNIARTSILGYNAWKNSRKKNKFTIFKPFLEKMINLQKEYGDRLNIGKTRYDSLLDEYEPGMSSELISKLFTILKSKIRDILKKIINSGEEIDQKILEQKYDPNKQWEFSINMIKSLGFDFNIGRQDKSDHPFTVSLSPHDVRITTRVMENYFPTCLFSTIHECGHALYDMGFMKAIQNTNLAGGASLSIHESQSRLWENMVGKSEEFWHFWYPKLQKIFPKNLNHYSQENFYRSINSVKPSYIRVEADEITYSLHIILRFEIEMLIFKDQINISELPELWNNKTEELLNLRPPNDSYGILQDVHWSGGAFGYFPTYCLGNLYASQIFNHILQKDSEIPKKISNGDFISLLNHLREDIHQYGKIYYPKDLIFQITSRELNPEYFIKYLEKKFFHIYAIK